MKEKWRIIKCTRCDVTSYYNVAMNYIHCDNCNREIKLDKVKRHGYDEN